MFNIKELIEPKLSDNAIKVLEKRYLRRDDKGKVIETPKELFFRVAQHISKVEKKETRDDWAKLFYGMMANLDFLPNTPCLINAGRELGQLSACFVLPITDTMEGIFNTLRDSSLVFKSGGGVGCSFSSLRPKNDPVDTTSGVSSGPISFMRVYNAAVEEIKQGGVRRGAMMGVLRVDHPDIIDFIKCKEDTTQLTNFNLSVAITNEFMKAVKENKEYWTLNPRTKEKVKKYKAKEVFDLIVKHAHKTGEPGILFIDIANKYNPTLEVGMYESTNPCGEVYLLPYESCNLGSINISNFLKSEGEDFGIDYVRLRSVVDTAVRFLDNMIDVNKFPLPQIDEMTKANRKIGLGVMGWADILIKLGISYDNIEAVNKFTDQVIGTIKNQAEITSELLAQKRGVFPNWNKSIYKDLGKKRRNACLLTVAPTGSISMIADCSAGIEPLFGVAYRKSNILGGESFAYINKYFEQTLKTYGIYSNELIEEVIEKGSIQHIKGIPDDIKKCFKISHDISPEAHINMQASFQKYIDNSISKTINFNKKATVEDIAKAYLLAYESGCKGITVYRDGSREGQILNIGKDKKEDIKKHIVTRSRPLVTQGNTYQVEVGCGNLYLTINSDDKGLCETFIGIGKSGGCTTAFGEALGRLISLGLRSGIQDYKIINELKSIRCPSPKMSKGGVNLSCIDAIAKVMEQHVKLSKKNEDITPDKIKIDSGHNPQCLECGSMLEFKEGCLMCPTCGFSKCN